MRNYILKNIQRKETFSSKIILYNYDTWIFSVVTDSYDIHCFCSHVVIPKYGEKFKCHSKFLNIKCNCTELFWDKCFSYLRMLQNKISCWVQWYEFRHSLIQWRIYIPRSKFYFMQFLRKFSKIVCWRPLEGWHPHLGIILDPPPSSILS